MDALNQFFSQAYSLVIFVSIFVVPVLLGFAIALQASPKVVGITTGTVLLILFACLYEFFLPDQSGGLDELIFWGKSIFAFFQCSLFSLGLACGHLLRRCTAVQTKKEQ